MESFSELVDKLSIVNVKLYMVKEKQSNIKTSTSKEELKSLIDQDISLCRQRSTLKKEIDSSLRKAIQTGDTTQINEVKDYGG